MARNRWGMVVVAIGLVGTACSAVPELPWAHGNDHTHGAVAPPAVSVPPEGTAPNAAGPSAKPATTVVSYKSDIVPQLRQHCASCHSPGGDVPPHGYWFDAAGEPDYKNIRDHAGVMVYRMRNGEMPPGDPKAAPLAFAEQLDTWRRANSPNN